jgi:hypothetical protein
MFSTEINVFITTQNKDFFPNLPSQNSCHLIAVNKAKYFTLEQMFCIINGKGKIVPVLN